MDSRLRVKRTNMKLDEVAAAIEICEGVETAAAILINSELWCFYAPSRVNAEAVNAAASKFQKHFAVPMRMMALESFPLTENGKTDTEALRRLVHQEGHPTMDSHLADRANVAVQESDIVPLDEKSEVESRDATLRNEPTFGETSSQKTEPSFSVTPTSAGSFTEVSSVEKGYAWAGFEDDTLPEKTNGKLFRNLRHQIFSLYRRLFGIVFITNMAVFIATLVRGQPNAQQLGQILVANVFCAILMRQDYVINSFFNVFCAVPRSWPILIRRICARVYTIGGIHSGCAVSACVWLILFTVQATREMVAGQETSIATVVVTYVVLLMFCAIIIFAHPEVRSRAHNNFEMTHRFLGWSITAMVWCQIILLTNDYREPGQNLGHALLHAPPFWLVVVMTMSIILPWTRLRKVTVQSEVLSKHAIRIYFDYVTPKAGSFARLSDSPWLEWHGFATVHEPGKKGYSVIVSRAGDWTSKQIENPPTKMWVRSAPTFGVMRIVPMFRRVIIVATGSGIAPCTPVVLEQRVPMRLLWTAPSVRETFGDKLVDSLLTAAPDSVIYDTRVHGKPDMVKLVYRIFREFDAEAVCIISNQKLTQKVVYGMMSRGIPAFGAIWDS